MAAMCNAAVAGKADEAHGLDELLHGLHAGLFLESNPIPVKWALMEMGKIKKGIRLPLTELSSEFHEPLRLAMRQAGVLS